MRFSLATKAGTNAGTMAVLAMVVLAGAGCNTFKYFDIHVTFDPATFNTSTVREIAVCRVTVSGADSASFRMMNCPGHSNTAPLEVGLFEYSSFADSGMMTFKLETIIGAVEKAACKSGEGNVAVPVAGPVTIMADMKIIKTASPPGCNSTTPINDGGP
jgi:hypothetical protein